MDNLTPNTLNLRDFRSSDCSGVPYVSKSIPKEQLSLTNCTDLYQLLGHDSFKGLYGRIYTMNENTNGTVGASYNYTVSVN